jgi:repressor of nif and glnA expression
MVADAELAAFDAAVQTAARALNYALRQAAERDLVAKVDVERQDLTDGADTRISTAPCVHVTLRRREGPDADPVE